MASFHSATTVTALPAELIALVFDQLDNMQLIRASKTCRRWHAEAVLHANFFKHVNFEFSKRHTQTPAIDFRTWTRSVQRSIIPLDLNVNVGDLSNKYSETAQNFWRGFVAAVAGKISTMRALQLVIHNTDAFQTALDALAETPSPMLYYLALKSIGDADILWPPRMFADVAPRLETLILYRFRLPTLRMLSNVRFLELDTCVLDISSLGHDHLPALRSLTLSGTIQIVNYPSTTFVAPKLTVLELNLVQLEEGNHGRVNSTLVYDRLDLPSISSIYHLSVDLPNDTLVDLMLRGLSETSLTMRISSKVNTPSSYEVEGSLSRMATVYVVEDTARQMKRAFRSFGNQLGPLKTFAHRIGRLRIPQYMWSRMIDAVGTLPELRELEMQYYERAELQHGVIFSSDISEGGRPAMLWDPNYDRNLEGEPVSPRLERLKLRSDPPAWADPAKARPVSSSQLVCLAVECLGLAEIAAGGPGRQLILEGMTIVIDDEPTHLRFFDDIVEQSCFQTAVTDVAEDDDSFWAH